MNLSTGIAYIVACWFIGGYFGITKKPLWVVLLTGSSLFLLLTLIHYTLEK